MLYNKVRDFIDRHFNKFDNELSYNELKVLVPDSETELHDVHIQKIYIGILNLAMLNLCFTRVYYIITDSRTDEFGTITALFFGLYLCHITLSISYYRSPIKHKSWKPEVLVILDQLAVFVTCFDGKLSAATDAKLVYDMTQRMWMKNFILASVMIISIICI